MKMDEYVRITKVKTINPNERIYDSYWLEAVLSRNIEVGQKMKGWRIRNIINPDGRFGLFESSPVKSISGDLVETENSIYEVRKAELPKSVTIGTEDIKAKSEESK